MRVFPAVSLAIGLALVTSRSLADTETQCTKGDCQYRFDDEGVNSPGWSAYGEWIKFRIHPPRARLIRPRISFVTELLKSPQTI